MVAGRRPWDNRDRTFYFERKETQIFIFPVMQALVEPKKLKTHEKKKLLHIMEMDTENRNLQEFAFST